MSAAREITRAMGGDWYGRYGCFPAPGHSPKDRGISIRDAPAQPDGIVLHCHNGADWRDVKEELRRRGLLPDRDRPTRPEPRREGIERTQVEVARKRAEDEAQRLAAARTVWGRGLPIAGTPAARYLPSRGITVEPSAVRYLPAGAWASGRPHAIMFPIGIAAEPEPGAYGIAPEAVMGVHVIFLAPDGRRKAELPDGAKRTRGLLRGNPVCLVPPGDGLSLAIAEGVENALTAATLLSGIGAWAAGGATLLPALAPIVPGWLDTVLVVLDPDPAGRENGIELACRVRARGLYAETLDIGGQP